MSTLEANWEADMRRINWFATAAAGAFVLTGMGVVWTNSSTGAFVPHSKVGQIDPPQIMMNAKDLPTQTYEDRTFVF
jgi:hypothetical protein